MNDNVEWMNDNEEKKKLNGRIRMLKDNEE